MKRTTAAALAALFAAACSDGTSIAPLAPDQVGAAFVTGDIIVTNSNDAGPGSFRDAINQAINDGNISSIGFDPNVNTISLQSGIVFSGTQNLVINANHATLDAAAAGAGVTGFLATGGGDLTLIGLTVKNAGGQGVEVRVPATATGTVDVSLQDVVIINNAGHGFMVDDQANDSPASVNVSVTDSRVIGNGYSVSDRDGIRVNEGGTGSITFASSNSRMEDNAADGIELDEQGDGDVDIDVAFTHLTRNGVFDPADLDDGFDIDEIGAGSIRGQVVSSSANHNYEEGLDFNENDNGDLRVNLTDVEASYNREEGIDYEEDDDSGNNGDIVATMVRVTTHGNGVDGGDGGLKIREKQAGNLNVTLTNVTSTMNSFAGIHVRESSSGTATLSIDGAVTNGNTGNPADPAVPGNGIELIGTNTVSSFRNITSSTNTGFGLFVEAGTANISNVKGGGNGNGLTGGAATFVNVP